MGVLFKSKHAEPTEKEAAIMETMRYQMWMTSFIVISRMLCCVFVLCMFLSWIAFIITLQIPLLFVGVLFEGLALGHLIYSDYYRYPKDRLEKFGIRKEV
jgi:hypothetical protein